MAEFFSFLKSKKPNAENVEETESNAQTSGLRVETTESAQTIREVPKRQRSESRESGKSTFSFEEGDNAEAIAAQAKVLDLILDPKVWRGAVAAPGDMMVAITGKAHWELNDNERDTLAKTGAATARAFMITDPKWIALTLFSFSIISIYGGRAIHELQERAEQKRAMRATKPVPPPTMQ